jgi:prepilin-type N-terminal cleavage/methylation domain-containing protein
VGVASRLRPRWARTPHLRDEAGYTLVELIIVLLLMGIIFTALVDGFVSASKAQVDQSQRMDDQQTARQVLERLRKDIHCASSAKTQPIVDSMGTPTGQLLQLAVGQPSCPGVTNTTNGVQWCSYEINPQRYAVYRTTASDCGEVGAVFQVDYVTNTGGNVWTVPACTSGRLQTVTVALDVNRDIATRPNRTYHLTDAIGMRNAQACA